MDADLTVSEKENHSSPDEFLYFCISSRVFKSYKRIFNHNVYPVINLNYFLGACELFVM